MRPMKILVTGAAGFIGDALVSAFSNAETRSSASTTSTTTTTSASSTDA